MKLIIDRFTRNESLYQIDFGVDYYILIGHWMFVKNLLTFPEELTLLDKLVTNSPDLSFCVMNLKNPILLKDNNWHINTFRKDLRDFWTIRLKHRKSPIDLIEFGKRLF